MAKPWFPIKSRNCPWSEIYVPSYAKPIVRPLVIAIFATIELVQWTALFVKIVKDLVRIFRVLDLCVNITLVCGFKAFFAGGNLRWLCRRYGLF